MQGVTGWAEQGGQIVVTGAVDSATDVQQSYPGATITVYLTGTATLATIFSDNNPTPTPLSNPFLASVTGLWQFYAGNGVYDIQFSGAGIATPFTIGAVSLFDSTHNLANSLGNKARLLSAATKPSAKTRYRQSRPICCEWDVKTAPVGGPINVSLYYTAAAGAPTLVASSRYWQERTPQQLPQPYLPAGDFWRVDIMAVGTTGPEADLTVTVQ